MDKTKRYYWIKLKTDFFNLAEIDFLLSQKDGCRYIVLYQMLCLQTANNNGELASRLGEMIIPYDADKIVRDTKYFSRDTVIVALELFKKLNLIYLDNGDCFKIVGFENMVGSETGWAKEKREQREKKKLLSGQCPENVLTEIDIDKELDIEIDEDIESDGLNDRLKIINLKLNKTNLIQEETTKYNSIFNKKNIYIQNTEYLPENLLTQIKLYQSAIKRLCDNKQAELLEKVTLSILEFLVPIFEEQLKYTNENLYNLIFTNNDSYIRTSAINEELKRIFKEELKIKHKDISTHSLRHTYGTRCIEAGMTAVVLQRLMGHKDVSVTLNTYTSVFNKFKEDELEKINKYLKNNK